MAIRILLREYNEDVVQELFDDTVAYLEKFFDFMMAPDDRFTVKVCPDTEKERVIVEKNHIPGGNMLAVMDEDADIKISVDGVISLHGEVGEEGTVVDVTALLRSKRRELYGDVFVNFYNSQIKWNAYFVGERDFQKTNIKKVRTVLDRIKNKYEVSVARFFESGDVLP